MLSKYAHMDHNRPKSPIRNKNVNQKKINTLHSQPVHF